MKLAGMGILSFAIAAILGFSPRMDATDRTGPAGLAVAGSTAEVFSNSEPVEDPFPIVRVRGTELQAPSILKQADSSSLVQLRRSDFEARVRIAGRAAIEAKTVPHITQTRYHATFVNGDLIGTAKVDLVNTSSNHQFLVLDPQETSRLALSSPKWDDGREAIVGVAPTGATSVWVDHPGRQILKFGWTVAGVVEFGERRFDLHLPHSSSSELELEVPVGQRPTAPSDVLLTGPYPISGEPTRAMWRFRFGERPRVLNFAIRQTNGTGVTASSSLSAQFEIAQGQITGTFEYDLRPARVTVGEWLFTVDPGLQITSVVVNNLAKWSIDPPTEPGAPRFLRIGLNQPGVGGKVVVTGVAAFPDISRPADSPLLFIRPVGALLDEETMEIRIASDMKPEKWSPGDYRLTDSQLLPDQSRVIRLYGTLLPPGADRVFRQPPAIGTVATEAEYTTTEQLAWRFDGERAMAQLRLGLRIQRGPMFRMALRIPAGYSFIRANSTQDDLIASATSSGGAVTVEFAQPLLIGQNADLSFEFRGPRTGPNQFAIPTFSPVGATERSGVLGIAPGPFWRIELKPGVGMTPADWLDFNPLTPPVDSVVAFRYRGGNPVGSVILVPIRPEFAVQIENLLETNLGNTTAKTLLNLQLQSGALSSLLIAENETGYKNRTWRVVSGINTVVSAIPVSTAEFMRQFGLFTPSIPGKLSSISPSPVQGEKLWLIRLAHPTKNDIVLETTAIQADSRSGLSSSKSAPGLRVLGAGDSHLASEPTPLPTELVTEKEWAFSDVYLLTAVRSEQDVEVLFGGTVTSAIGKTLPIALPNGSEVLSSSIGMFSLERGVQQLSPEGVLAVPVSASGATRFEIRYRLTSGEGVATHIRSPEPGLPGSGVEIRRWWIFSGNTLPGWPVRAWDRCKSTELPSLLGPIPIMGSGALCLQTSDDEVSIGSLQIAHIAGIVLSISLFLLGWIGGLYRHRFCGLSLVGTLLVIGLVALLGPPLWQRAVIIPIAIGTLAGAGMVIARGHRSMGTLAIGLLILCPFSHTGSIAQAPAPATVVLLPADADDVEKVVVPKAVLDRLAAVSRPASPGAIITAADYVLTLNENSARISAKLIVHALGESNLNATLPLYEARLEQITLDGEKTVDLVQRAGVYTIPLAKAGRHEIDLRFAVSIAATGTERELLFGVPECPSTRITADFPTTARQIQLLGRIGKQTVDGSQRRLALDAGSLKTIHFRWREGVGGTAAIKVREACLWDVCEKGAELTACYITRVEQGTVSTLRYDLPSELEPVEVAIRPLDLNGEATLRNWSIGGEQGGLRQLRLDLQVPTTGRMLTVVNCRLKKAATLQPLLRFPKPVVPGGNAEPDVIYGMRVNALRSKEMAQKITAESLGMTSAIDFDAEKLLKDKEWSEVSALRLNTVAPIRVFRPIAMGMTELRPTLRRLAEQPVVGLTTTWQVEPHQAQVSGTIRWNGKESLSLIEFSIPGIRIQEINGPDVGTWNQSGGRISVWLRKASFEGELEWLGIANPLPPAAQPANPFPVEAVVPRFHDAKQVSEFVRIHPAQGWKARVERDRGWTSLMNSGSSLSYQTSIPGTTPVRILLSPDLQVSPSRALASFRPSTHPQTTAEQTKPTLPAPATVSNLTKTSSDTPTPGSRPWLLPVSTAIGWASVIAILAVLLIRFPRTTWPEQFGLAIGLFGIAIVGHFWIGLLGWAVMRAVWLVEVVRRSRGHATDDSS